ncbi:hypothetical protein M5K25_021205 [Dendrobium thyrsiflorum]|uniref:Uncharacterized protein n=1 Tax=Dendrobium thyrsiflorum TaxID=117978 RepID=A0ABD0UBR9_DENTH
MPLRPGPELVLPARFPSIFFPIGNGATGFFVLFALVAAVVGATSAIAGLTHLRFWNHESMPPPAASAIFAWVLTLTAMGEELHISSDSNREQSATPVTDSNYALTTTRGTARGRASFYRGRQSSGRGSG